MKTKRLSHVTILAILVVGISSPCGKHLRNPEKDLRFDTNTIKFQYAIQHPTEEKNTTDTLIRFSGKQ